MVRDKTPTAQETFMQMAQAAGLRGRLLITVGMLILVRLGAFIPVPGIDRVAFQQGLRDSGLAGLVSFVDVFVGGGLSALRLGHRTGHHLEDRGRPPVGR